MPQVKCGPQIVSYTSKSTMDGGGSTVAGIPLSPAAPSAAVTAGTAGNLDVGAYTYKVSHVVNGAESDVSSASAAATITNVTAPSAPSPSVSAGTTGSLGVGLYQYAVAYGTAVGETEVSSVGSATITSVTAPSAPSPSVTSGTAGNLGVGVYQYAVAYGTSAGETEASSVGSATIAHVTAPSAPSASVVANTSGNLSAGAYTYAVEHVTAAGETTGGATVGATISNVSAPGNPTLAGTTGGALTPSAQYAYVVTYVTSAGETDIGSGWSVNLGASDNATSMTAIPTSSDGRVTRRRIYRTRPNPSGTLLYYHYFLVGTINDNSTTTFTDTIADTALTTNAPSSNTSGCGQVNLTSIPTGDGRVTARRIYRTIAGGSQRKLLATLSDNSTTTYTDNVADANLGVDEPTTNTSGSGRMTVTIPASADGRVTKRYLYRTTAGGSTLKRVATINDNTTLSYADNVPDTSLSIEPTVTNTSGSGRITVTIPTSADGRVTKRYLYRTTAGGSTLLRVTTINNNTTTTYADNVADTSLSDEGPSANDSGSGRITVSSIPTGPAGTTARRLYRTTAGGSTYKYVGIISDNVTTTFADNVADGSLGAEAPTASRVGAKAGDTTLRTADLAQHPASGWVRCGEQIIRYTGRSASSGEGTLTGVPASGVGSIGAGIAAGVSIVNHPHLTGVSGIAYTIKSGDDVNVLVTRNDTAAQTALAATEGGDGIHEHFIQDRRLSIASCEELGDAQLTLYSASEASLTFTSRDTKLRSGKSITVNLGAPTNISGTFKIQRVVISGFGIPGQFPLRQVTASSYLFTIDHLLRRVVF